MGQEIRLCLKLRRCTVKSPCISMIQGWTILITTGSQWSVHIPIRMMHGLIVAFNWWWDFYYENVILWSTGMERSKQKFKGCHFEENSMTRGSRGLSWLIPLVIWNLSDDIWFLKIFFSHTTKDRETSIHLSPYYHSFRSLKSAFMSQMRQPGGFANSF